MHGIDELERGACHCFDSEQVWSVAEGMITINADGKSSSCAPAGSPAAQSPVEQCDGGQGFLLAGPLAPVDVERLADGAASGVVSA
jgi:hypothetical protein